jgi:hypothetical protein
MLVTDLKGLWDGLKHNTMFHLVVLLCVCAFLYSMLSGYMSPRRNNFENVKMLYGSNDIGNGTGGKCRGIPKMDEAIIRNMIDLPNRNPAMLTSSMVIPEITKNVEDQRRTRMDILNMFYNTFDEDAITIKTRPQGLYVIP